MHRFTVIAIQFFALLFIFSISKWQHILFVYRDYSLAVFAAVSVENVLLKKKKRRQGECDLVALSDRACCHGVLDQIG